MDLKELLGTAANEANKHPELLSSVLEFAKGKVGGGKEPATAKTKKRATAKRGAGTKGAKREPKQEAGLEGLLGDLDVAGLAEQVGSWVGTGPNKRVSGKKVEQALGSKKIAAAAKRAGVSKEEAATGIAKLLPALVDYLTPDGKVPSASRASKRLEALEESRSS